MLLPIKKIRESAVLPHYATDGSAACDLYADIDSPITLRPNERRVVPSGIAIELPPDFVALVCARSGLSTKRGIALANGVGVIDSDYRGEVGVSLINLSDSDFVIEPRERIAQLMILPVVKAEFEVRDTLNDTERGVGGFGSTGTK